MNLFFLTAAILTFLLGLAHSILGERFLLIPLFRFGEVPRLFGSRTFAKRVFRFAWHLTTILMWGLAALIISMSLSMALPIVPGDNAGRNCGSPVGVLTSSMTVSGYAPIKRSLHYCATNPSTVFTMPSCALACGSIAYSVPARTGVCAGTRPV